MATPAALGAHVDAFTDNLERVVARLRSRLQWAMQQIARLNALRERHGTLEPDDEALFRRCDRLVKRLKGTDRRSRRQAEGHDDVNTFSVLAAEGFLPGYGLEVGSVVGWAEIPFWRTGAMDFQPAAPARDGSPRVRARQPHLRQRPPVRGPALSSRPARRPRRRIPDPPAAIGRTCRSTRSRCNGRPSGRPGRARRRR